MRRMVNRGRLATVAAAVLAVLATFLVEPASAQDRHVLRIGMHDHPPLSIPGGGGPFDRMILELFHRAGVEAELVYMPYERSLADANSGALDGEGSRLAGLEQLYPNLVMVPESTLTQEFVAFAVKPGIELHGWESLRPYAVGYLIGWKVLEENVKAERVSAVANPRSLFAMLKKGRIDIAIHDRYAGPHFGRELDIVGIYPIVPPLKTQSLYLYLNKKHAGLAPVLFQALGRMKADGSYDAYFIPLR